MQEFNASARLSDKAGNEKFDILLDNLLNSSYIDMDTNEPFSQTGFILILDRSPAKFFLNIYIPTFLLTISSFIGFLIPVEMVPGRMALLVTIFLMLVNMSSTEQNRGPIVRPTLILFLFSCALNFISDISDKRNDCNGFVDVPMHDFCRLG